jgi:hypothetical protein
MPCFDFINTPNNQGLALEIAIVIKTQGGEGISFYNDGSVEGVYVDWFFLREKMSRRGADFKVSKTINPQAKI